MRTHRRAPRARILDKGLGRQAKNSNDESTRSSQPADTRPSQIPPPATRPIRRTPLRRMPTELIKTTRMPPVRQPGKPASGVRTVPEPTELPFDQRLTGPLPADAAERIDLSEAQEATILDVEMAKTVVPARSPRRTPVPPPPPATPHHATAIARYAIADELPQLAAAPAQYIGPVSAVHHPEETRGFEPVAILRGAAREEELAAPLRPAVQPRRAAHGSSFSRHESSHHQSAPVPSWQYANGFDPETPPDARAPHAAYGGRTAASFADQELTQARRQLAAALEQARKHEQRAMEAELRASWAERYVPQMQEPEHESRTLPRHKRLCWLKRMLGIGCVGLAIGGYISLLVPVRERVIAQDAMIHQLTALQQQLRDEKRMLQQRIESMQSVTPP